MSQKPNGFTATCRCGVVVGAMDLEGTPRQDAAKLLGEWLMRGCTVTPQFADRWTAHVESCKCAKGTT